VTSNMEVNLIIDLLLLTTGNGQRIIYSRPALEIERTFFVIQ